ncbi:MAG: hypothetical protein Fur005_27140 [Roseiflexaceae bacterium]
MQILLVGTQCGLFLYQRDGAALVLLRQLLEDLAIIAIEDLGSGVLRVAGSDGSVRQSYDAGVSWHPDAGSPPAPLAPTNALTTHGPVPLQNPRLRGATAHARLGGRAPILIGAGAGGMMIFRSEDDGIHWQAAQMLGGPYGNVTTLAPDLDRRDVAWAATDQGAILRSGDRGTTWKHAAQAPCGVRCLLCQRASARSE